MRQMSLFDPGPVFTNRSIESVTFKGKLALPIHRWYRLTPSFSPQLAHDLADHFELTGSDLVLDPFSGVGTVPLCMKYRGIPSCSIEINPYLRFVSTVKTRSYTDLERIQDEFESFLGAFERERRGLPKEKHALGYLAENAEFAPPIRRPERWWSRGNLMQLTCLRKLCLEYRARAEHADLLKMGVLSILVPVSNARHNHVSLTFADPPLPTVNVASVLRDKYREMIEDLYAVVDKPVAPATVYEGNSKEASKVLPSSVSPSAIITSPPYPNRFSYARETRPHLFFFNFLERPSEVGQLETEAIGGTWGKATSVLADGVSPANDTIRSLLAPFTARIQGNCSLMAAYVTKYFNDMYAHAGQIAKICQPSARLAYVIGNSKFFGLPLPSDEILSAIFRDFGFTTVRIERMRRRQSKTGLHEAVVLMQR